MFWPKTKRNDVDSFCCDQAGKILTGSQRQTSWAASVLSRLQDSLLDLGRMCYFHPGHISGRKAPYLIYQYILMGEQRGVRSRFLVFACVKPNIVPNIGKAVTVTTRDDYIVGVGWRPSLQVE